MCVDRLKLSSSLYSVFVYSIRCTYLSCNPFHLVCVLTYCTYVCSSVLLIPN